MTPVHSHTGREEVSEYLNDAYRTSSNHYKAPTSTRMWVQPSQRDKLKRLSSEARTPVLQFLRERPPLRRTLSRDSPYLEEAFQLAVDAIGQANETQQWETLAEILMDACLANPAASIDLHEVLYGVVTPAGQWGFWGQGALKKLVAPISSIAGFGLQAFRNNQPRDFKHPSSRSFESSHSDADDFSIGTARSDSNDSLPPLAASPLSNSNRLPPSIESIKPDSSSDQPSRSESAFTQQNLPAGDPPSASNAVQSLSVSSSAAEQSTPSHNAEDLPGPSIAARKPPILAHTLVSGSPNTVAQARPSLSAPGNKRQSTAKLAPRLLPKLAAASVPEAQASSADVGSSLTSALASGSKASWSEHDNQTQQDAARETALAQLKAGISSHTSAVKRPLPAAPSDQTPAPDLPQESTSIAAAAAREGSTRPLTKPLRSKRSADAMADSEVRVPMLSRPRMSLAPPGSDQRRPVRIGRVLDDLPDPKKMTEKELLEFDFSDIERRLEELANRSREDRIARHGQKHYDEMQARLPPYLRRDVKLFKEDGTLDEEQAQSLFAVEAQTKKWLADNPRPSRPDAALSSRVDQLKSRVTGALAHSHTASSSSRSYRDIPGLSQEVLDTLADADSIIEYSKKQNTLLEDLMKPEQRVPYREFKKEMEERAKQQEMGITPAMEVPKGAITSLEAARTALDKFQHERMASIGSFSEPLACAQQQLAELEVSLAQPYPAFGQIEAYKRAEAVNMGNIGDNASLIAQAFPDQAESEGVSSDAKAQVAEAQRALAARKQLSLETNPYLAEAHGVDPDLYACHADKVKATLDGWKAGKVPNLSDALKEQLGFGALDVPGSAYSALPALEAPMSSAPVSRYLQGLGTTVEQRKPLATVTEVGFPLHQDPGDDDLFNHEDPPLGIVPLLTRGFSRPVMRPQQDRAFSCPGRGPMPPFITSHPRSRPFGVAQSSIAIREAAQLHARDPTARQRTSRKHAQPRLEQPPPKPENLPAGFEMPDKLPSPETAVGLLAQANRASERFASLSRAPQHASTCATPAVLGMDSTMAGTAADYIKDHPLIDPRGKPKSAAAATGSLLPPQGAAAPAPPGPSRAASPSIASKADSVAPTALPGAMQQLHKAVAEHKPAVATQPLSPSPPAQSPTVGNAAVPETVLRTDQARAVQANPPAATPVATIADQPVASPASTAPENAAAAVDAAGDDGASSPTDLQQGKANKQRPGRKQRRRLKDMAEAAKAEDEARKAVEATAKAEAEAEAAAKAVAEAAAKAKADAEEKARRAAEVVARQAAEAAALKAADELLASEEKAAQAAAKKKANKQQKKKAKGAALQIAANAANAGPSGTDNIVAAPQAAAAASQAVAAALQDLPPTETTAATAKSKVKKKKKGQQASDPLEEQAGPSGADQGIAGSTAGSRQPSDAAEQSSSLVGPSQAQALPAVDSLVATSNQGATSAVSLAGWLPAAAYNGHVSGRHALQRQPSPAGRAPSRPYMPPEAAQTDSADGWTVVNGHQRHAEPAVAHHAPADAALAAVLGEQPADAEEQELEEEEKIGLAALEGYFPLRRRGVRAGKRHKKRYGARDAAARHLAPSEYSDDDSDHTVSGHFMPGQLPRSPLAGQLDNWDYPGASDSPVRGVAPPPGLPVADWPSIAAEHQARQSRHASLRLSHAQAAQVAQQDAVQRALTAADIRRQADAMSAQGSSADVWPALQMSEPMSEPNSSSSGVLPRDAAAAMAQQIVAESQPRDAAATLAAKPKPKARIRGVARTLTAAEAAAAAAAAATAGLLGSVTVPAKASRKTAQGGGTAAGGAAQADAHTRPEQQAILVPVPEVQPFTAQTIELLEAELEAEYCCPLTLVEFEDPVRAADGRAYERSAIQQWLETHDTSPMTNEPMPHKHLIPDPELLNKLHDLFEKLAALVGE